MDKGSTPILRAEHPNNVSRGSGRPYGGSRVMSAENKALVQRVVDEIYNRGDLSAVDDLFAADFSYRDPLTPAEGVDREGFKEFVAFMRATFPDIRLVTESMLAEGDLVAQRWSWTATREGELFGVAPDGRVVSDRGVAWVQILDGKVAELSIFPDVMGMLRQLEIAPEMAAATPSGL